MTAKKDPNYIMPVRRGVRLFTNPIPPDEDRTQGPAWAQNVDEIIVEGSVDTNGNVKTYVNGVEQGGGGQGTYQTKSVTYTPATSSQTASVTPDAGYDAMTQVDVTVNAMPAGSVEVPDTNITANPSVSVNADTGDITAIAATTVSVSPSVTPGYVSSGDPGDIQVTGVTVEPQTTQGATTYTPSTSERTIAKGKFLTGKQTIEAVTTTNLIASNIVSGVTVQVGSATDPDSVASVTGTASGGGGEWTTDGLMDRSEPNGAITTTVAAIASYAMYRRSNITSVSAPNATVIGTQAFYYCTNLASVSFPSVTSFTGNYNFNACTSLTSIALPSYDATGVAQVFYGCSALATVDYGKCTKIDGSTFTNCASLATLILRRSSGICTLANTNAFNGTPFASGGAGGTIYVPSALIATYQAATNWSTLDAYGTITWAAIEGSVYE